MKTTRAYRFALDLTPAQERVVLAHAGAARFAVNWGLAQVKANLAQREAERTYGLAADELTPAVGWTLPGLRTDLARAHARVANLRRDGLHRLTTGLVREFGTVVVEDLNVAGMVRNRRLAKAIADCGFGELRRQLAYKTVMARRPVGRGAPVVSVEQDMFGLRRCESQAAAAGPDVRV